MMLLHYGTVYLICQRESSFFKTVDLVRYLFSADNPQVHRGSYPYPSIIISHHSVISYKYRDSSFKRNAVIIHEALHMAWKCRWGKTRYQITWKSSIDIETSFLQTWLNTYVGDQWKLWQKGMQLACFTPCTHFHITCCWHDWSNSSSKGP